MKFEKGSGLDLDTKPFPSMIVPLASSKIMKVFGASGFSLFDDRNILEIKPLDSSVVMMDKLVLSSLAGMGSHSTRVLHPSSYFKTSSGSFSSPFG